MNNGEQFFNTAAGGGYSVSRSLRFNAADSSFLSRTPASQGNRRTWTWAGWVKRSKIAADQYFFGCNAAQTQTQSLYFSFAEGSFNVLSYGYFWRTTTAVFRDPSAWYHVVVTVDTTQATANNRIRVYINGVEQTTFSTINNPAQNADMGINQASAHVIGDYAVAGGLYLNGLLADIHFCDGTAYDASAFGEFDANGIWQPKKFAGVYGSQGWHLDFADNSAATAAALGKDTSGLGNNWTPNNLSVTAGAGNDSLIDVPVNGSEVDTGLGNQVRGNYCTWNPLAKTAATTTLSNGNLEATGDRNSYATFAIPSSGKWYWEITPTAGSYPMIGVAAYVSTSGASYVDTSLFYYGVTGQKYNAGSNSAYGSSYTSNDVIGVAVNADSGTVEFYKNGSSQGSITYAASGLFPATTTAGGSATYTANFGQRPFAYPVAGFKSLNTASLPAPVVTKPSTVMDVALYTGTGSANTRTVSFSPDFVWVKPRSNANPHQLFDTVRGDNARLKSNATDAEYTYPSGAGLTFGSTGFTVGTDNGLNQSGESFVAWAWDAGTTTVTNTQGSISSQVRANPSAGFSVVTYTGTGSVLTLGHGLGVKPAFFVVKRRDASSEWTCYHSALGASKYISLQSTAAASSGGSGAWNSTEPTSSLITIGSSYGDLNANGGSYLIYAWAPLVGYSSMGSYVGNGSATDGPFVFCNFRPRWIMIKDSSSGSAYGNWMLKDALRPMYNTTTGNLYANATNAEDNVSTVDTDILSNGFKLRGTYGGINTNGVTYIYAAFAESPFAANNRAR